MKQLKLCLLLTIALLLGSATSAWAQVDPSVPVKQSDGSWKFKMPAANKLMQVEYYSLLTLNPTAITDGGTVEVKQVLRSGKMDEFVPEYGHNDDFYYGDHSEIQKYPATETNDGYWNYTNGSGSLRLFLLYGEYNKGTTLTHAIFYGPDNYSHSVDVNNGFIYIYFKDGKTYANGNDEQPLWNGGVSKVEVYGSYWGLPEGVTATETAGVYNVEHGMEEFTIKATPAYSKYLTGWSDVQSTDKERTITVTKDTTITATFATSPVLTIETEGNGKVKVLKDIATNEFTLSNKSLWWQTYPEAAIEIDSEFAGFASIPEDDALTWPKPNYDKAVLFYGFEDSSAKYIRYENNNVQTFQGDYIVQNLENDMNNGLHVFYTTGISLPDGVSAYRENNEEVPGKYYVAPGSELTLLAKPDKLNSFIQWSDESTKDTLTYTMGSQEATIAATFAPYPTLTLDKTGEGTVEVERQSELLATLSANQTTDGVWTLGDLDDGNKVNGYLVNKDQDPLYADPCIESVEIDWTQYKTIYYGPGDNTYEEINIQPLVRVKDNKTYVFKNSNDSLLWDGGISKIEIYSYRLPDNLTEFTENNAVVDGKYIVAPGTVVPVVATPEQLHYFKNWSREDDDISTAAVNRTFEITKDSTFTAYFAPYPVLMLAKVGVGDITFGAKTNITGYTYIGGTNAYDNQGPDKLIDGIYNNDDNKWCTEESHKVGGVWFVEFYTADAVQVNGYTLYTGGDTGSHTNRNPKNWVLKGRRNVDDGWTVIDTKSHNHSSGLPEASLAARDFLVDNPGYYKYFHFEVSNSCGIDDDTDPYSVEKMQLAELQLFYYSADVNLPEGITNTATDGVYNVAPETKVAVVATAAQDYHFDKWTDKEGDQYTTGIVTAEGVFPTTSTIALIMTADTTVQANFDMNGIALRVPAKEFVTYYSDIALGLLDNDYIAGAALYTITEVNGTTATATQLEITYPEPPLTQIAPANTPLLIYNSSDDT